MPKLMDLAADQIKNNFERISSKDLQSLPIHLKDRLRRLLLQK